MNKPHKLPVYILCGVLGSCLAHAEYRRWTDTKENSIEAEFVRLSGDTVVLKKRDAIEIKVSLNSLCEEDRQYAMLLFPPKLEFKVESKVLRETTRGAIAGPRGGVIQQRLESISVETSIRKTNMEPYEMDLKLVVFLIAKTDQFDRRVILERSDSTFRFSAENQNLFSAKYGPIDLRSGALGNEYEGYLVIVCDSQGRIIGLKGSRNEFEKHAETILGLKKRAVLDRDFEPIRGVTSVGSSREDGMPRE